MPASPGHRRRFAWFALVAIWALALVPTVSRALAFAAGDGLWAEVCTTQGPRFVSLDERGSPSPQATHALEHCKFCTAGFDGAAPLPAVAPAWQLPQTRAAVPRLFLQAPRPLFAWRRAQPRAPPAAA